METNKCYITEYLQERLDKRDEEVLNNLEKFRSLINESKTYDGKLKDYERLAPKLISVLNCGDNELNNLAYERILRINEGVSKDFKRLKRSKIRKYIPENKEINKVDYFTNEIREFELFVAIINGDINEINKLLPKVERNTKAAEKVPDSIKINDVTYNRVKTYGKY